MSVIFHIMFYDLEWPLNIIPAMSLQASPKYSSIVSIQPLNMTENLSLLTSQIVIVFLELNCFPKSWQGMLYIWQIMLSSKLPWYWQHGHDGCCEQLTIYQSLFQPSSPNSISQLNNYRYTFAAVYIGVWDAVINNLSQISTTTA